VFPTNLLETVGLGQLGLVSGWANRARIGMNFAAHKE